MKLRNVDGVLVPGGFGTRGIEGMILAAKYCRESETPYFGEGDTLDIVTLTVSFVFV